MNVKMLKWVLPMFALPTLVISCSQDDDPNYKGGEYVSINSVGVGELQTRSGYDAADNFMPDNGILKLLLTSSNDDPLFSSNGTDFTPDGSGWYTENPVVWAVNSTADWSAFFTSRTDGGYSYNAETKELTWTIPADQASLSDEEMDGLDLLYAYGNTSSSAIDVAFNHLMSKVQFNFIDKTGHFAGKEITSVKFTSNNWPTSYVLPISTGVELNPKAYDKTIIETANEVSLHKMGTKDIDNCIASFDGILIPRGHVKLDLLIYCNDSSEYCYKTRVPTTGSIWLSQGVFTEMNLIVGGDYLIVDSATVHAWNDVDAGKLETE